jgi:hypothetical protein
MHNCIQCGKETLNPKFCSRSCAAIQNNKTPKRKKKLYVCSVCGKEAEYKRKFCKDCRSDYLSEKDTRSLSTDQAKLSYQVNSNIRGRARSKMARSGREKACAVCGYDTHVDVCHIKPVSSFSRETPLKTINALDNLVYLCKNHHWELDHGLLQLS